MLRQLRRVRPDLAGPGWRRRGEARREASRSWKVRAVLVLAAGHSLCVPRSGTTRPGRKFVVCRQHVSVQAHIRASS